MGQLLSGNEAQQIMSKKFFKKSFLTEQEARNYSKKLFASLEGGAAYKDEQCPKSDSFYNNEIFKKLAEKVKNYIEKEKGVNLATTFNYSRIYRKGEILQKHTDRNACEYSATITLDYSGKEPWNFLIKDQVIESIMIDRGDILIYDGVNLPHWRDELKDEWQSQVFLFFSAEEKEDVLSGEAYNRAFDALLKKSQN